MFTWRTKRHVQLMLEAPLIMFRAFAYISLLHAEQMIIPRGRGL